MRGYGIPAAPIAPPRPPGAPIQRWDIPKDVVRVGEAALWSTWQYTITTNYASTEQQYFTTPRGQVGQGFGAALGLPETNLRVGGQIPGGYAFDCTAIAAQPYYTDSSAMGYVDLANLRNNVVLAWSFLQVRIEISPLSLVGEGGGIFGGTADTGNADAGRTVLNNGNNTLWIYQEFAISLPEGVQFALLTLWGPNAVAVAGNNQAEGSAMNLRLVLLGKFQTAIEIG